MPVQNWRVTFLLLFVVFLVQDYTAAVRDDLSFLVVDPRPKTKCTGTFNDHNVNYDESFEVKPGEEEMYMSWEEAWPRTGRRVGRLLASNVNITEKNRAILEQLLSKLKPRRNNKNRSKRKIFYGDNRYPIPLRTFGNRFPFTSVVKLSTGCTGTLVSPKHVLTAAHCIHNQSDYVEGFNNLMVGLLPNLKVSRKLVWIRVNESFLPNGWLMGNPNIASRFDYALLELERTHKKPFFELAISEGRTRSIIHFTAYEDDKPANSLWYRVCRVKVTDEHVLYHRCDAQPGSSGAGVYTWNRVNGEWNRRLIGVFSGYRWKSFKEWWRKDEDYNAAIRLNTLKYNQICRWMGKYAGRSCKQRRNRSS